MPPMIAYRIPRWFNVETSFSKAWPSAGPAGGKESSALLTPLLPLMLSSGLGAATPLARDRIFWCHRSRDVEQRAQCRKPLIGRSRAIRRDLHQPRLLERLSA